MPPRKREAPSKYRCDLCLRLHKKCDGDGVNPCSRCAQRGIECKYLNKRKPGPRQGWVNDLKRKVQKLQSEVAYGTPLELVGATVVLQPESFGPDEMALLDSFFRHSNSLVPVVGFTSAEVHHYRQ